MIRNVWAVGRNYSAHAKEMGTAIPSKPMIFLKAGSSVILDAHVPLYRGANDLHHEIEIALRFGTSKNSHGHLDFDGAALAIDLTARDVQTELKSQGHPWTLAKSFRNSCPLSAIVPLSSKVPQFTFELSVNGDIRQRGNTDDMLFNFESLRSYLFEHFPVEPGDLLLTGTPEGVAKIMPGDQAKAWLKTSDGAELKMQWQFV